MKFADGTKLGSIVDTEQYRNIRQKVDDHEDGSNRNGLKFNSIKCKIMHLVPNNFCYEWGLIIWK